MSGTIMPAPWFTGLDDDGNPVSGGLLWFYDAGTSTLSDTWSDADLNTLNTNPVVLDGAGRAVVFLDPGKSYDVRLEEAATPPAHGALIKESFSIASVPLVAGAISTLGTAGEDLVATEPAYLSDGSGGRTAGRWYKAKADLDYSSTLPTIGFPTAAILQGDIGSFSLAGELTVAGPLTAGAYYYISAATAGAITTTAPSLSRRVGQASTTTRLLLTANPPAPTVNYLAATNILANQSFG